MLVSRSILWLCNLFYKLLGVLLSKNEKFECQPTVESLFWKSCDISFYPADSIFQHEGEFHAVPMGFKSSRVFNHLSISNYVSASTEINTIPHTLKVHPYLSAFLDSSLKNCP